VDKVKSRNARNESNAETGVFSSYMERAVELRKRETQKEEEVTT